VFDLLLLAISYGLMSIGAFCSVVGAIGMIRFPGYFVRLHAATVSVIGGGFTTLLGLAFYSAATVTDTGLRFLLSSGAITVAIFVFITSPVSTHAVARASHKFGVPVEPKVCDKLEESGGVK
jgi:multicomponent Na+:H+ antiporter subunit G